MSWCCTDRPRWTGNIRGAELSWGRDGERDKVKLDEFAAAIETAKNLAETKHFQTVYVIDEADAKRTIG